MRCVLQVGGEDEVRLDEEMERVVWGDAAPRLPPAAAEPRRDAAAPPPYAHLPGECPAGPSAARLASHSLFCFSILIAR